MKARSALFLLPFLALSRAFGESAVDAAFLKIAPPRAAAMGGATDVTALGVQAGGGNPANLGRREGSDEAFAAFQTLLSGAQYSRLSYAHAFHPFLHAPRVGDRVLTSPDEGGSRSYPSGRIHISEFPWRPLSPAALGLSVTQYAVSGLTGRDDAGRPTGNFSVKESALGLTGATQVVPGWGAGVTGRLLRSDIGARSAHAFSLDVGGVYAPGDARSDFSVGFGLVNLGRGYSFDGNRPGSLPSAASAAASWRAGKALWTPGAAYRLREDVWEARGGIEYGAGSFVARGGYRARTAAGGSSAILRDQGSIGLLLEGASIGFGFRRDGWDLDYAVAQTAVEWGFSHTLALTAHWGLH